MIFGGVQPTKKIKAGVTYRLPSLKLAESGWENDSFPFGFRPIFSG